MKKIKLTKVIASTLIVVSVLALNPIGASAAWKQDSKGWWNTEGSCWSIGWKEIDGKWYYFGQDGYMAHDTTIDGYYLNSTGAWVKSIIQTQSQKISVVYPSSWNKLSVKGRDVYYLDNKGTNVNLVSEDMKGSSEEDYYKAGVSYLKINSGIDNINVKEKLFNNKKAMVIDYVYKYNNKDMSIHQVAFCNNNTAYIFTLTEPDRISDNNLIAFENMLNTVEFKN